MGQSTFGGQLVMQGPQQQHERNMNPGMVGSMTGSVLTAGQGQEMNELVTMRSQQQVLPTTSALRDSQASNFFFFVFSWGMKSKKNREGGGGGEKLE